MVKTDPINLSILRMVGLYRVATRTTVVSLLPEKVEPDKRLGKLAKEGLLRAHKGLPGNRSVYQLTKKGAVEAGVSPARGRTMGAQSMLKNLGVLLFCHMPDTLRFRVESEQLGPILGGDLDDGAYCLCKARDQTIVFECYVPATLTPVPTVVRHLRKQLKAAKKNPGVAQAVKDLRYGFAVIVATPQRRKTIMDAIRTKSEDESVPLVKRARIWVEAVNELAALFGTTGPSAGRPSAGAAQTLLWDGGQ